jgi:hypothetical protein
MKQEEAKFKERVLRDLKQFKDAYFLKTQERGRRGVPDIIGCINGKFISLELKTDKGVADLLQLEILKKIQIAGGFAAVTSPMYWEVHLDYLKDIYDVS